MPREAPPRCRVAARPRPGRSPAEASAPAPAPVTRATFLGALAVIPLAACTGDPPPAPDGPDPTGATHPDGAGGSLTVTTLARGLEVPWSLAFHDGTALISERETARILEVGGDGEVREVARIAGVRPRGEGGLLGIAVHEGHLYAYSTGRNENRIRRFAIRGDPGALSLGAADDVLARIPAAVRHNGGRLAFGPDAMLYATTGDAGDRARSQDPGSLAGTILRLTPAGDVPDDNPFPDSPVYSYGHRNVQGIAWGEDGTLYASEFGQDRWDELNVIQAGGDYGWPQVEGSGGQDGVIDPVQQWEPQRASPSGIAVADGSIHIANLRGRRLTHVPADDLGSSTESLVEQYGRLRDIVRAPDGSLRVLTSNTDGRGEPGPGDDRLLRLERA